MSKVASFTFKQPWETLREPTMVTWPKDVPFHTVSSCHDPLGCEDGSSAHMDALHMQADLPWPLAQ